MEFLKDITAMDHGASLKALLSGVKPLLSRSSAASLLSSTSSANFDLDSATLDKVWIAILGIEPIMIAGLVLARVFQQCFRKQRHLEMYL